MSCVNAKLKCKSPQLQKLPAVADSTISSCQKMGTQWSTKARFLLKINWTVLEYVLLLIQELLSVLVNWQ